MKKTLLGTLLLMGLTACTSGTTPAEVPTINPVPSVRTTEASKPQPEPVPTASEETKTPEVTSPAPQATTSEAGTPAVQFAQRWGKRYPDVPEFAILKAANATCDVISSAGNGWEDNPIIEASIASAVIAFGLSNNDALEFAQDADQNYCATRQ